MVGKVLRLNCEAFVSLQKKGWFVTAGFEPTNSETSFSQTPLEETFFHTITYTRDIKRRADIQTGTAASFIKLKFVLTNVLQ
jgi:hypothetical protein